MTATPEVRPGQIWADNDPRAAGRTLRVDRVDRERLLAECTVLTDRNAAEYTGYRSSKGRSTRIGLHRFKPTSTGYRLIRDRQYGIRWPGGSVFSFGSREDAVTALREDGRGVGVLVVCEVEPGAPNSTEWEAAP